MAHESRPLYISLLLGLLKTGVLACIGLGLIGGIALIGTYLYLAPGLPPVSSLKDVKLQTPLRVYSADGELLAEYGEKRRRPLSLDQIPPLMQSAFVAAEDDRFFEHPGVDYQGLIRAAWLLVRTGEKVQGGSTITMQLTRNFFLTPERTYTRKIREIFLALRVENELSKEEILQLYLNKIYLGHRAYGVGAAAEVYYGVLPEDLTLAQMAMIGGLPKAPSTTNPVRNPTRAIERRNYVLARLLELDYIDKATHDQAVNEPISARIHNPVVELEAPFVGEIVRAEMAAQYGDEVYTRGLRVFTTLNGTLQRAATVALRRALLAYDRRHGYRGPEASLDIEGPMDEPRLLTLLHEYSSIGGLYPAIVTATEGQTAEVFVANRANSGNWATLEWDDLKWARPYIDENKRGPKPKRASDIFKAGDVVRVFKDDFIKGGDEAGKWRFSQVPAVSGALVSLDPNDGDISAMVGGFDYFHSKFNRVTQARRQPGSSFKPFIYSAALEKGFTPASIINDAPVVFNDRALEDTWRPVNYSGKFYGPTRLREALTKSRNLVSIRLLYSMGQQHAMQHIAKFGFDTERLPNDLSLSLGSGDVTPLELATGYAVFANGGYRITSRVIERVESEQGELLHQSNPAVVCPAPCEGGLVKTSAIEEQTPNIAEQVLSTDNAYQIVSMMKDVIRRGTGRKAMDLKRKDLAGKTGTTNDQRDAWFSGYNADIVATAWVGFDEHTPLGKKEVGGTAALPMWIDFMRVALGDRPASSLKQPEGMVTVRIDPDSGLLASASSKKAIFETFRSGHVPKRAAYEGAQLSGGQQAVEIPEQLF